MGYSANIWHGKSMFTVITVAVLATDLGMTR
jgi:hypothetical protein